LKAYSIDEVVKMSPFSRSGLYKEIAAGRLIARKSGSRTVILESDYNAFLNSLPKLEPSAASKAAGAALETAQSAA
jgi:hypothetical protein